MKNNKGFTLIEVVIALFLMVIIGAGVYATLQNMNHINARSRLKAKEIEISNNIINMFSVTNFDDVGEDTIRNIYDDCIVEINKSDITKPVINVKNLSVDGYVYNINIKLDKNIDYNDYQDIKSLSLKEKTGCTVDSYLYTNFLDFERNAEGDYNYVDGAYEFDDAKVGNECADQLALAKFKERNHDYVDSGASYTEYIDDRFTDEELFSYIKKSNYIEVNGSSSSEVNVLYTIKYELDVDSLSKEMKLRVGSEDNFDVVSPSDKDFELDNNKVTRSKLDYLYFLYRPTLCKEEDFTLSSENDLEYNFYFVLTQKYNKKNDLLSLPTPTVLKNVKLVSTFPNKISLYSNIKGFFIDGTINKNLKQVLLDKKVREYNVSLDISDSNNLSSYSYNAKAGA